MAWHEFQPTIEETEFAEITESHNVSYEYYNPAMETEAFSQNGRFKHCEDELLTTFLVNIPMQHIMLMKHHRSVLDICVALQLTNR